MASLPAGAAFGAALILSGVYQPSVIISQLSLKDWQMLQTFMAAAASSTLFVALVDRLGYVQPKPRGCASLGLFSRYDGNIVGGLIQGAGMALSGACPGTALAQAATGLRSGLYAVGGAFLGGIVWARYLGPEIARRQAALKSPDAKLTVHERAGVSKAASLLGLETLYVAIIAATMIRTAPDSPATFVPVVGGLFIGLAQLFSLLTRKSLVGVSGAYEDAGKQFWSLVRGTGAGSKASSYNNILFAVGIVAGAWGLTTASPSLLSRSSTSVSPLTATVGGILLTVGARMAGGCSSGHGLSGMSLFSISSFITMAAAFAGGIPVARLVF